MHAPARAGGEAAAWRRGAWCARVRAARGSATRGRTHSRASMTPLRSASSASKRARSSSRAGGASPSSLSATRRTNSAEHRWSWLRSEQGGREHRWSRLRPRVHHQGAAGAPRAVR
eukprot:833001-Prymnesium_polylepis.2